MFAPRDAAGSGRTTPLTRRRFLMGAAGIAALALAACGGGAASPSTLPSPVGSAAGSSAPSTAGSAAPSAAGSAAPSAADGAATARATATVGGTATASRVASPAAGATARATVALPAPSGFPATLTHQYGTTEVKGAPKRVLSVGYTDQDFLLALGVVPVGILRWFATQPRAVGPWAEPLLGSAQPQIIPPTDLDFEALLKLTPDLIVGIQRTMKPEEYQRLSVIAPTVSQPAGFVPFGVPWRDQARLIATAVGQKAAMEQIITDLEGRFTAAKGANPQFTGKVFSALLTAPDGQYYAWTKQDGRVRFLEALGMTLSPRIDTGQATAFYNTYSRERINELDADVVLVIGQNPAAIQGAKDDALLAQLGAAKAGRMIFLEDTNVIQALSMNTVLSLPYAIDQVVPLLARVVR